MGTTTARGARAGLTPSAVGAVCVCVCVCALELLPQAVTCSLTIKSSLETVGAEEGSTGTG